MTITCRCGCGGAFEPSPATIYRLKRGDEVGWLAGHKLKGARNPLWKGGRFVSADGYIYLLRPDHPNALKAGYVGYVAEHRMVMSAALGRPLLESELVHHKNEDKADNRLENLELTQRPDHARHHMSGAKNPKWKVPTPKICKGCKQPFTKTWRGNHARDQFCSRACMTSHHVGEFATNVKLSDADVAAIRALNGVLSRRQIAKRFSISKSHTGRLLRGEAR